MGEGSVRGEPMSVQATLETYDASARVMVEDALAWYEVVGIELGLFSAILASLLFGALWFR